jgi:hypothetical protein
VVDPSLLPEGMHWMTPSIDYLREISQTAMADIKKEMCLDDISISDIKW